MRRALMATKQRKPQKVRPFTRANTNFARPLKTVAESSRGRSRTSLRSAPPWRAQLLARGQPGQRRRCAGAGADSKVREG